MKCCGMVKGGAVGLALATAGLFWVFGGRAVDLIQSKAEKGREWARTHMTSFEDEIAMTKKAVEKLGPAIADGAEALAKLEENVKDAELDVQNKRDTVAGLKRKIGVLHASLENGSVHRVSDTGVNSVRAIETKLAKAIDACKQSERTLAYSEDALTYSKAQVEEARARLDEMKAQRQTLISKINEIDARHKARIAARQFNEFTIDTSPLAAAQKAVSELDKRESRDTRADELKAELAEDPAALDSDVSARDVRREAQEILQGVSYQTVDRDA